MKLASLPQQALFDPAVNGLIRYPLKQETAYLELMGRMPPEPFAVGTLEHEQWTYRPGAKRSVVEIAAPGANPLKKAVKRKVGRSIHA